MENFMIKAIKMFKKTHKGCEIRTCAAWEMSGRGNNVDYALFNIEYVDEPCSEYKSTQIAVYKDKECIV